MDKEWHGGEGAVRGGSPDFAFLLDEGGTVLSVFAGSEAAGLPLDKPAHGHWLEIAATFQLGGQASWEGLLNQFPAAVSLRGPNHQIHCMLLAPQDRGEGPAGNGHVLVLAHRRAAENGDLLRQRASIFGLSEAEIGVVSALSRGESLGGISGRRAVSIHTVRNQLRSAFRKTNTKRQAQLVALLSIQD